MYLTGICKVEELAAKIFFNKLIENAMNEEYLFHFTKKRKNLINILLSGFKPFYCFERLDYLPIKDKNENKFEMAFPMVCFCDISNEEEILKHKKKFGNYGIGMKKEWAKKNYLTPVIYCNEKTLTAESLNYFIDFLETYKSCLSPKKFEKLKIAISVLLIQYKSYEGFEYDSKNKRFKSRQKKFYDEREWRYIPHKMNKLKYNLIKEEYDDKEKRNEANSELHKRKENILTFSANDIGSIILRDKDEEEFILSKIKNRYSVFELKKIQQKIRIENEIT
jgi:hypothetical protein